MILCRAIGWAAWLVWTGAARVAVGAAGSFEEALPSTNLPPVAAARGQLQWNLVFVGGVGLVFLVLAALAIRSRRGPPPP